MASDNAIHGGGGQVVSTNHSKSLVWSKAEISDDLLRMKEGKRERGAFLPGLINFALESMCQKQYRDVAVLYQALRDGLRLHLTDSDWRPTSDEMMVKVVVDDEASGDVQIRLRRRLVMVEQIIRSLDPDSAEAD